MLILARKPESQLITALSLVSQRCMDEPMALIPENPLPPAPRLVARSKKPCHHPESQFTTPCQGSA